MESPTPSSSSHPQSRSKRQNSSPPPRPMAKKHRSIEFQRLPVAPELDDAPSPSSPSSISRMVQWDLQLIWPSSQIHSSGPLDSHRGLQPGSDEDEEAAILDTCRKTPSPSTSDVQPIKHASWPSSSQLNPPVPHLHSYALPDSGLTLPPVDPASDTEGYIRLYLYNRGLRPNQHPGLFPKTIFRSLCTDYWRALRLGRPDATIAPHAYTIFTTVVSEYGQQIDPVSPLVPIGDPSSLLLHSGSRRNRLGPY